jgi:Ca2+-transporting ATPase
MRQGHGFLDALVSAATLAVAAMPEEFPVVFTVFLGVGVYRLARTKALVRRAVTVENIGRVTCICSDKTGTITEGRLALEGLVAADNVSTGKLLGFAALASRRGSGDPIDRAIWEKAAREGPGEVPEGKLLATFPYTEKRRRETSVVEMEEALLAVTKGSPEVVLEMTTLRADQRAAWSREVGNLASEGKKIIACASRHLESPWTGVEPDREYRLLGALLFVDPLRDGVREAIATCRRAGIRVLMITGDHPDTARAVAATIGLGDGAPRVVLGEELFPGKGMTRSEALAGLDVVARAMPEHKLSLVQALKEAGEVVVVTGDGVNDVPALKAADIGVAMGERGTRSAREVASIVLLDDNFRSIVRAIAEGRQLFENLRLSFQYLLMVHIPLVLTATFIPLAGYPLLYLPLHIVWLEALIHPSALLVFQELPPSGPLARVERKARFFGRFEWVQMGIIGMLGTILVALSYERSLGPGPDVEHARAMALVALTSFSACLVAFLSRLRTWTSRLVALASFAVSALLVQVPMLAKALHVEPLHFDDWAIGIAGGFLVVAAPRMLMNALRRQ